MEPQTFKSTIPVQKRWLGSTAWPCFSPDGKQIAFSGKKAGEHNWSLMTIAVDGTSEPKTLIGPQLNAKRPAWHPNGHKIAFNLKQSEIWTIDLQTQKIEPYLKNQITDSMKLVHPCYAPDGNSIVCISNSDGPMGRESLVYRLSPGAADSVVPLTSFPQVCAGRPGVSPDGQSIVFAGNAGHFNQGANQLWVVTPPEQARRLEKGALHLCQGRAPRWSPDGKWIAFISTRPAPQPDEELPRAIWLLNLEDLTTYQLTDTALSPAHVAWSPDQRMLAFSCDGCLGVMGLDGHFSRGDG